MHRLKNADSIAKRIARDAEKYKTPVKTVSLTSHVHGYTTFYNAIVVFEEEQALAKMKEGV